MGGNNRRLTADDQQKQGPVHPPICDLQNGGQRQRYCSLCVRRWGSGDDECTETLLQEFILTQIVKLWCGAFANAVTWV